MPGLHRKEFDSSTWTKRDWSRAQLWNVAFFVAWNGFFAFPIYSLIAAKNWLMLVLTLAVAITGAVLQIIGLARIASRLTNS